MPIYYFHLRRSWYFTYIFLLLYGLGYFILGYLPLSNEIKYLLFAIHTIESYLTWQYQIRFIYPDTIKKFWYQQKGKWYLCTQEGNECAAQLQPGTVCMYYLTVLHFKLIPSNHPKVVVLFLDSLSSTESRRLRRLLWWER